jgi:chemotaxis regulatin CheY-phosphate phosphatase CheZ
MNQKDITVLLKKSDELRALFMLGQRILPFLEEIFVFVSEIEPVLTDINSSIQENLKKMPKASKQLSKVTEATELATNEIMDILDGLTYKSDIIVSNLKRIKDINQVSINKPIEIIKLIRAGINQDSNLRNVLPEIDSLISILENETKNEIDSIVNKTTDITNSILSDSSSIMISLQVQDITSQQIAAVNSLLETVQVKLSNILHHFQSSDLDFMVAEETHDRTTTSVSKLHRPIAFDPDAVDSYSKTQNRQQNVDNFVEEHLNSNQISDDEPASQDDIDALFKQMSGNENILEKASDININLNNMNSLNNNSNSITNLKIEDESDNEFSQDDIDAMFGK